MLLFLKTKPLPLAGLYPMSKIRDLTPEERAAIEAVRDRPDEQIDTSDIPEVTDWSGALRGASHRPALRGPRFRGDTSGR